MKRNVYISLILTLAFLMTMSGCSSYATATDITTAAITSVAATTKEPTETAAVTTPTPTPAMLEAVVTLPVPATYASLFDGTKIYSDGSRTVILKTLVKGDQVTITGTSGQYGVTAEGSFVNLHLMSVVVTVTPTPAETTAAPTDPTAATTKATAATTKAPAATTKAPAATTAATTAAPPVETAPPAVTTAAPATDYTAMCADIRSKLIANLEANGKWDPNGVTDGGWGQKWWEVGYFEDYGMSTQDVADEYYKYKFSGAKIACGVNCYVADGKIYLDYQSYTPA